MVNVTLKFKDGTIFSKDGRRYLNYGDGDVVAGKYYYLKILNGIHLSCDKEVCNRYMKIIYALYCVATSEFNPKVIASLLDIERKSSKEDSGIALFMSVIYLAMVDLEQSKKTKKAMGKKIVYESCKDVLVNGKSDQSATEMFAKQDKEDVFELVRVLKEKLSKQRT